MRSPISAPRLIRSLSLGYAERCGQQWVIQGSVPLRYGEGLCDRCRHFWAEQA